MQSVEKEGMKLFDNLGKIAGAESDRLQELLEDFGKHGTYMFVQSLGNSQSADKAPTLIYNLKEHLTKVSECSCAFQKWPKFKKIGGKPATYGAQN